LIAVYCVVQLYLPSKLYSPWPVGNRLRYNRSTDSADHSAEQVSCAGPYRRTERWIVSTSLCFCCLGLKSTITGAGNRSVVNVVEDLAFLFHNVSFYLLGIKASAFAMNI